MMKLNQMPGVAARTRGKTIPVAVLLVLIFVAGAALIRSRTMSHESAATSRWMVELDRDPYAASREVLKIGAAAVPPLIKALNRQSDGWLAVYRAIFNHLPLVAKQHLAPRFDKLLQRESRLPQIRGAAAQSLGDLGPVAAKAAPALVKALRDTDATVRRNAAFALGKIGSSAALTVPELARSLQDTNGEVRTYAAIALKKFGLQASSAVPELIMAGMRDRDWKVRERALLALGAVGHDRTGVIPALERGLLDEHRFVRISAATALAALAPQAATAKDALARARYDPDAEVRFTVGLALDQIEGRTPLQTSSE